MMVQGLGIGRLRRCTCKGALKHSQAGADVDKARTDSGATLLLVASEMGHLEVAIRAVPETAAGGRCRRTRATSCSQEVEASWI